MKNDIKASKSASSPSWIYREVKWLSIGLERVVKRARPVMWWWCMRTCEWGTHEAFFFDAAQDIKEAKKKKRERKKKMHEVTVHFSRSLCRATWEISSLVFWISSSHREWSWLGSTNFWDFSEIEYLRVAFAWSWVANSNTKNSH